MTGNPFIKVDKKRKGSTIKQTNTFDIRPLRSCCSVWHSAPTGFSPPVFGVARLIRTLLEPFLLPRPSGKQNRNERK